MIGLLALALGLDEAGSLRARLDAQPRAVVRFVERRADCNHWGGEEPYDKARRRQIDAATRSLRCDRIGADERVIRRQFRDRPATLAIVDET